MEYSLPHAVMAFLQEEHSANLPKSYFISSSTRTTKITLIYTRRKPNNDMPGKTKALPNGKLLNSEGRKHRSRCSSSSTDDYTQKSHAVDASKYDACTHNKMNRRMCASTPGRGYSGGMRTREMHRSQAAGKMATDPVLRNSPHKDSVSLRDFASNHDGQDDSDADDNFGTLSPNSLFGDRPPTPGRDFNSSTSPRPPTPNASNYATLVCSAKYDQGQLNTRPYHTPSKQSTVVYGAVNSRHQTQAHRRSNNENGSHDRRSAREELGKHSDSSRLSQHKLASENALFTLPPTSAQSIPETHLAGQQHSSFSRSGMKR